MITVGKITACTADLLLVIILKWLDVKASQPVLGKGQNQEEGNIFRYWNSVSLYMYSLICLFACLFWEFYFIWHHSSLCSVLQQERKRVCTYIKCSWSFTFRTECEWTLYSQTWRYNSCLIKLRVMIVA